MRIKKETIRRAKRIMVTIGVVIIPVLYSSLYLGAFWDPYSRLETLPVAIVNLDEGGQVNGEERNLGDEIVKNLTDDGSVDFTVTDQSAALEGTKDSKYYGMITIPEGFTETVATADSTKKETATILFSGNEKRNYLACQILKSAVSKIEESVRGKVANQVVVELSSQLSSVPDQLSELTDGLDQLSTGASDLNKGAADLSQGAGDLADGAKTASVGASSLASGAADLSDGALTLDNGLRDLSAGAKAAQSGAASLAVGTKTLAQGSGNLKTGAAALVNGATALSTGTVQFTQNMSAFRQGMSNCSGGTTQLSAGVVSLNTGISSLLTGTDALLTSTADIGKISDGTKALADGALALSASLSTYADSVDAFILSSETTAGILETYCTNHPEALLDSSFAGLMTSLSSPDTAANLTALTQAGEALRQASATLSSSASTLSDSSATLPQIHGGLAQLKAGLLQAQQGAAALKSGTDTLSGGLSQLDTSSGLLLTASQSLSAGAGSVLSGATSLSAGATSLDGGLQSAATGAATLSSGVDGIATGAGQLTAGADALSAGASQLDTGAGTLADGTDKLAAGAATLSDGSDKLLAGTDELSSGLTTALDKVKDSSATAQTDVKKLDGLSDYVENSVTVENKPVYSVPNYGTAFAPYFLSLSLWVGGLMIFLGTYMDTEGIFRLMSRNSEHKVVRTALYFLFAVVQSLVLGYLIEVCLGLKVANQGLYYAGCLLFSITALSIIQFLMVNGHSVGKFLCILFLILQLTACGGTFPMETVPKFFNIIYPFMPMTYSVGFLKEAISGDNPNLVWKNAIALIGITAVFTVLSLALTIHGVRKEKKRNQSAPERIALS